MNITQMIRAYLNEKKLAWAPSTLKTESARLMAVADVLTGDAAHLWAHVEKTHKPYTRRTLFTRVSDFWQWAIDEGHIQGPNPYDRFRRKNARLFKYTYEPKVVVADVTYEEAVRLVNTIPNSEVKRLALQILVSGERYSEAIQDVADTGGIVIGKGNKPRSVYRSEQDMRAYRGSYLEFRRELGRIGLKPHDLRKLCATRLADKGLKEADLMKVMGWASIVTAKCYLQPKREEELRNVFEEIEREVKRG